MPWFGTLPARYREELSGMAEGAQLPVARLAEWFYVELCDGLGCSSAVGWIAGRAWVARNNDADWIPEEPDLWGHAVVRAIDGCIPTLVFGQEGEMFAPSGVNAERLWLHDDWLPDADDPADEALPPCWIWAREALETCASVADVERLLAALPRHGGMNLFVVDGKTEEGALFECSGRRSARRGPVDGRLIATNHACELPDAPSGNADSVGRFRRFEQLLAGHQSSRPPDDLVRVLADDVEVLDADVGTVYATVACPSTGELWYTAGGFPAASAGTWQRIAWPWAP